MVTRVGVPGGGRRTAGAAPALRKHATTLREPATDPRRRTVRGPGGPPCAVPSASVWAVRLRRTNTTIGGVSSAPEARAQKRTRSAPAPGGRMMLLQRSCPGCTSTWLSEGTRRRKPRRSASPMATSTTNPAPSTSRNVRTAPAGLGIEPPRDDPERQQLERYERGEQRADRVRASARAQQRKGGGHHDAAERHERQQVAAL